MTNLNKCSTFALNTQNKLITKGLLCRQIDSKSNEIFFKKEQKKSTDLQNFNSAKAITGAFGFLGHSCCSSEVVAWGIGKGRGLRRAEKRSDGINFRGLGVKTAIGSKPDPFPYFFFVGKRGGLKQKNHIKLCFFLET